MTRRRRSTKADQEAEAQRIADEALERERKLDIIVELLLVGSDDRGIQRTARDERWKLDADQVQQLIDDARGEIRARARSGSRDDMIDDHMARLDSLYRRAVRAGQHVQAAKILKEQRTLAGLERVDRGADATRRPRDLPDWLEPPKG